MIQISLQELHEAAEELQKGNRQRIDGIALELYLAMWEIVGPLIHDSIENAIKAGSFKLAIISLLLKKKTWTLWMPQSTDLSL